MIPLFWTTYNGKDIRRAMKKLFPKNMSNRWLGQGAKVDEFEREFGKKFGYEHCLAVNSGTSALELAYHLLGIDDNDEVIVPVFTCTATNIPLLRRGARIVFADINTYLTPDYDDVVKKITPKTKAIVLVTLGGMPLDPRFKEIDLPVVIDAAQSLGVREEFGDFICYSFQAIKHFTTGDGGMLVCQDKYDYQRAKKLRWFGIDREAKKRNNWQPYKNREMTMDIHEAGYKYHMNDISASLGLSGLKYSDKWLKKRKQIGEYYRENLKCPVIVGGSYWLACILVGQRDSFAKILEDNGIETNVVQLRNDIFKVFGGERQDLPQMNSYEEQYLYIPIHAHMSMKQARHIVKAINANL